MKNDQFVQRQTDPQCVDRKAPSAWWLEGEGFFSPWIYTLGKWLFSNVITFSLIKSKKCSETKKPSLIFRHPLAPSPSSCPSSGTHVHIIPFYS